ncbi:MAG: hypothetical protein ABI330_04895 [Caldimonas sp.]
MPAVFLADQALRPVPMRLVHGVARYSSRCSTPLTLLEVDRVF